MLCAESPVGHSHLSWFIGQNCLPVQQYGFVHDHFIGPEKDPAVMVRRDVVIYFLKQIRATIF